MKHFHCKVFRHNPVIEGDSFGHSWWATCKYPWGSIDTVHPTWKNAMDYVNAQIAYLSNIAQHQWAQQQWDE